jgi:hypothetical protein
LSTYFTTGENTFNQKDVIIQDKEQVGEYKSNEYSQPMPRSSEEEILGWAKSLIEEAYNYRKEYHQEWHEALLSYYTTTSMDDKTSNDANPGVHPSLATQLMVPPLIKRFVDLISFWLCKEIYKAEPFIQFTSYSTDNTVREAQKLLERKYQGDSEKYGAREKATDGFIDLALFGNTVFKAKFHQERLLVEELMGDSVEEISEYDNLLSGFSGDINSSPDELFEAELGEPKHKFDIVDQYAEFSPIFIGNFFIDPYAPGKDWRRAAYMGDVEFVSSEEIFERFRHVKGFKKKFSESTNRSGVGRNYSVFGFGGDAFSSLLNRQQPSTNNNKNTIGRRMNSVLHLYTKYTETVIINDEIVVYHKIRDTKVRKAGAFPYIVIKMPGTSNSMYGVGLGRTLKGIQYEQTLLASQRLKMLDQIMTVFIEAVEGGVNKEDIERLGDMTIIPVAQPGAIQFRTPPANMEQLFLAPEARNVDRAREYAGLPGMIDSSNTKTHLGAVDKRMEASQVGLDVLLDRVRDSFKRLHSIMHIYSMAYLSGDQPLEGSTVLAEKDSVSNVLTEEQLATLRLQPELVVQLNAGVNIGADKFKSLSTLLNTGIAQTTVQQLLPEKQIEFMGQILDLLDLNEFKPLFQANNMTPPAPPMIPGVTTGGGEALAGQPPQGPPQMPPPM